MHLPSGPLGVRLPRLAAPWRVRPDVPLFDFLDKLSRRRRCLGMSNKRRSLDVGDNLRRHESGQDVLGVLRPRPPSVISADASGAPHTSIIAVVELFVNSTHQRVCPACPVTHSVHNLSRFVTIAATRRDLYFNSCLLLWIENVCGRTTGWGNVSHRGDTARGLVPVPIGCHILDRESWPSARGASRDTCSYQTPTPIAALARRLLPPLARLLSRPCCATVGPVPAGAGCARGRSLMTALPALVAAVAALAIVLGACAGAGRHGRHRPALRRRDRSCLGRRGLGPAAGAGWSVLVWVRPGGGQRGVRREPVCRLRGGS